MRLNAEGSIIAVPASSILLDNHIKPEHWLAAIIEGSQDAIISKDLNGNIRSWNDGAMRLFGYTATEVIGKPVSILIPSDRLDEETRILENIRHGRRVEHFQTIRRRKDGSDVHLSLTISPIRNDQGEIVGASKIARDITEQRQIEEQKRLIVGEMRHRLKNLFALSSAIVSYSARNVETVEEVVQTIQSRLGALSAAHDMTMRTWDHEDLQSSQSSGELMQLIQLILAPYRGNSVEFTGPNIPIGGQSLTNLSLVLHELATNAAKYGALSVATGKLSIRATSSDSDICIYWDEFGSPPQHKVKTAGFGSRLEAAIMAAFRGVIERVWTDDGLRILIRIPRQVLSN